MKVITSAAELRHQLASFDKEQVALVPTMGCLHEGHVSLMQKAKRLADIVVVSIYVNPLQFGEHEDLDTYPRQLEADSAICEQEGVDFLFHPENLYPDNKPQVSLTVDELSQSLCGASRSGHFDGVVTVVNILFNIVQPHIAIFGEKDFQQLTIIQRMVADLYLPVQVIGAETVRERDGLAKSSRNQYLSAEERLQAKEIYAALIAMQEAAALGKTLGEVLKLGQAHLLAHNITPEYLEICDTQTLLPVASLDSDSAKRIMLAAKIGTTRLIDNMPICFNSADNATNNNDSEDETLCV